MKNKMQYFQTVKNILSVSEIFSGRLIIFEVLIHSSFFHEFSRKDTKSIEITVQCLSHEVFIKVHQIFETFQGNDKQN